MLLITDIFGILFPLSPELASQLTLSSLQALASEAQVVSQTQARSLMIQSHTLTIRHSSAIQVVERECRPSWVLTPSFKQ